MFNFDLLIKRIDFIYNGSQIENKYTSLCRDSAVKCYRFKRALEGKTNLQADEIFRIAKVLKIKLDEIYIYFFQLNI